MYVFTTMILTLITLGWRRFFPKKIGNWHKCVFLALRTVTVVCFSPLMRSNKEALSSTIQANVRITTTLVIYLLWEIRWLKSPQWRSHRPLQHRLGTLPSAQRTRQKAKNTCTSRRNRNVCFLPSNFTCI